MGYKEYRQQIIQLLDKIENTEYLEFIYNLLQAFKKKWGI